MKSTAGSLLRVAFFAAIVAIPCSALANPPHIKKAVVDTVANTVTINGGNFSGPNLTVTLKNLPLTVTSSSAHKIVATLPPNTTAGSYHLVVTTAGGTANLDVTITAAATANTPSVGLYDGNGQFLGLLVEGAQQPVIIIPSSNLIVTFEDDGNVLGISGLLYTTADCSGTPYIEEPNQLVSGQVLRRYQGNLVTFPTSGPPVAAGTVFQSFYSEDSTPQCRSYGDTSDGAAPVTLTPATLPFTVPVVKPLSIKVQ